MSTARSSPYGLLLRAALVDGDAAGAAWAEWSRVVDLDDVDAPSFPLLPQVYRNLTGQGVGGPSIGRLRGVCRHTWLANQVLDRAVGHMDAQLTREGFDTLRIGGASRARYYATGARSLVDAGLLVEPVHLRAALAALAPEGWTPVSAVPRQLLRRRAVALRDRAGTTVALHWRVLGPAFDGGRDEDLRARAVGGALAPCDELLHAVVHGVAEVVGSTGSAVPWPADVAMVVRHGDVDWGAFVDTVRSRRLVAPVRLGLSSVSDLVGLEVPSHVWRTLGAPASPAERVELWAERHHSAAAHWFRYRRVAGTEQRPAGPVDFARWVREGYDVATVADFVRRKSESCAAVLGRRRRRSAARRRWGSGAQPWRSISRPA